MRGCSRSPSARVIGPVRRSTPLRVILDTNVLLSGIYLGGVPGRLLTAWQDDRLALVLSPAVVGTDSSISGTVTESSIMYSTSGTRQALTSPTARRSCDAPSSSAGASILDRAR